MQRSRNFRGIRASAWGKYTELTEPHHQFFNLELFTSRALGGGDLGEEGLLRSGLSQEHLACRRV